MFQMDDGNIIIRTEADYTNKNIKIINIKEKEIKIIQNINDNFNSIIKLSNQQILSCDPYK